MADRPLLTVANLQVAFRGPNGEQLAVLDDLSFQLEVGEFLCLVGPSGCGKTTLLRLIAGLEQPDAGKVRLAGSEITPSRRAIGFVFQEPTLMAWRTVEANVSLPLEISGTPKDRARSQARELLKLVGLSGFETAYPAQLSGGMAQRVALARALIHDPQLLLLDEPFGSLDALTREQMGQELLRIWQVRHKTVIMVTHSVSEAVFLADRVLVMGPRPTAIIAQVPVNLDRPRLPETRSTAEFGQLAQQVRQALLPSS